MRSAGRGLGFPRICGAGVELERGLLVLDNEGKQAVLPRPYATESLRPQTLLFTFLGHHILSRGPVAVASSTFIDVLQGLGVSVQAARSTFTRMVSRGHLERHRVGRRAYFSISEGLADILEEGKVRLLESPVRDQPQSSWTLLSFSIPEDQRGDRHALRTALSWNGFGLLRNGLWIAPGEVDVVPVVERLDLGDMVEVFTARPAAPTDVNRIVSEAWALDAIREQYEDFIARWSRRLPRAAGELAGQVRLLTEWRQILVGDPSLPADYLPRGWPALKAHRLFRRRLDELEPGARDELEEILDIISLD